MAREPKDKAGESVEIISPRFVVTITSREHRRRAGFAFGPEPTHLTEEQLDEEKIAALKADPLLSIRPYEAPEAPSEPAA